MIRRIKLVNFMSHAHTVIEPAEGLTILIGQNNCGKSAIVSALRILSGNASGDFMVRHGERECVISVETDEGHVIEWRRKGGVVSYRINGRDIHRLQGGVPDELHGLLRLPEVQAEGDPFEIHFAEQKHPIFLLNESAGRRATFFASSSDAIKLIEMQKIHSRKILDAKRLEADLTKREGRINTRIEALASLDDIEKPLIDLEILNKCISDGALKIFEIHILNQHLERSAGDRDRWFDKTSALNALSQPPEINESKNLRELVAAIDVTEVDVNFGQVIYEEFRTLVSPPMLNETTAIIAIIAELFVAESRISLNSELRSACASLASPPEFPNTVLLADTIRRLNASTQLVRNVKKQLLSSTNLPLPPETLPTVQLHKMLEELVFANAIEARQRQIVSTIANITEPPVQADNKQMAEVIGQIQGVERQITELELSVGELQKDLERTESDLHNIAEVLKTCPVCGQEFDLKRLLSTVARHTEGTR